MSDFETHNLRDGFEFLLKHFGQGRWRTERRLVQEHLLAVLGRRRRPEDADLPVSVSYKQHPLAWYLFLVESFLEDSPLYEHAQGARVVPFVARLGLELDNLAKVDGVDLRLASLLEDPGGDPDGTLFELLVAAAYVRNGWTRVELLKESKSSKTPDLRVSSGAQDVFVECKRFRASSTYSLAERDAFWRMWSAIGRAVVEQELSLAIEITFHEELEGLDDDVLWATIGPQLEPGSRSAQTVETDVLTAIVRPARLAEVQRALDDSMLRWPSSQVFELLMGNFEPFHSYALTGRVLPSSEYPFFVESVSAATCVRWACDNPGAIRRKARHIRRMLAEATKQLPPGVPGVVHIGLEALDGDLVERHRFSRIKEELARFDPGDRRLEWVFGHVFAPYVPPHTNWELAETGFWASAWNGRMPLPLQRSQTLVLPDEHTKEGGVHWS